MQDIKEVYEENYDNVENWFVNACELHLNQSVPIFFIMIMFIIELHVFYLLYIFFKDLVINGFVNFQEMGNYIMHYDTGKEV